VEDTLLQEDVLRSAGTRLARLRHRLGLDRNPLRRRSDRIEAFFLLITIAALVPLATVATIATTSWTHSAGVRAERAGATLRPVTAVLEQPVPTARPPSSPLLSAPAHWVAYGKDHVGLVTAVRGSQAGARIQIWVDRAGHARPAPPTSAQIAAQVVLVAVITPPVVAFGLWLSWRLLRRLLDRRRMAAWGRAWSVVGPRWTRQR